LTPLCWDQVVDAPVSEPLITAIGAGHGGNLFIIEAARTTKRRVPVG
jgi:hypothetical protein